MIPGLNMPDYGTSITSTIYVRGLGSRMDNPVIPDFMWMNVPTLDKNCDDFAFSDIRRIVYFWMHINVPSSCYLVWSFHQHFLI